MAALASITSLLGALTLCATAWAIVGMSCFGGALGYCDAEDFPEGAPRGGVRSSDGLSWRIEPCGGGGGANGTDAGYGGNWVTPEKNFDSFPAALFAVFLMWCGDGFTDLLWSGVDSAGVEVQPALNGSLYWFFYFFVGITVFSLYFQQLFVQIVFSKVTN